MVAPSINEAAAAVSCVQIPNYKVIRPIGAEHTASVYLAEQESQGRRVALKILDKFEKAEQAVRFLEKNRKLASFNHKHIITIHDVGTTGDHCYLATEYLEGGSLAERLSAGIEPNTVLDIVESIGTCLDFAHRRGIIHRNVKPANILLHADGTPKLTDFGVAGRTQSERVQSDQDGALLSRRYKSPEQTEGRKLDGRSDIYALGIVLYEALTGSRPYAEDSPAQTVPACLESPIPMLPAEFAPYQELLARMIAKDPEARFESAGEMVGFLKAARMSLGGKTSSIVYPQAFDGWLRRRSSVRNLVSVAIVASVLAGSAFWLQHDGRSTIVDPSTSAATALNIKDVAKTRLAERNDLKVVGADLDRNADRTAPTESSSVKPPNAVAKPDDLARDAYPKGSARKAIPKQTQSPPEVGLFRASAVPEGIAPVVDDPAWLSEIALRVDAIERTETEAIDQIPEDPDAAEMPTVVEPQADQWLAAAETAMREYRLTTPVRNSAVFYYRKVLETEPKHPVATEGMAAIAKIYVALARRALNVKRLDKAERYIVRGLSVEPRNTQLQALVRDVENRKRQAKPAARSAMAGDSQPESAAADSKERARRAAPASPHPSILDLVE